MTDELKQLFEEQSKLCSMRQFTYFLGYNYSYLCLLKAGKRNASQRFIRDFKDTLKKLKKKST